MIPPPVGQGGLQLVQTASAALMERLNPRQRVNTNA